MIKIILILFALIFTSKAFSQIASRIAMSTTPVAVGSPTNFLSFDVNSFPSFQIRVSTWDSVTPLKNMKKDIAARWDSTTAKNKLASHVTTLALTGMSLTAGGNTVVIPSPDMSGLTPMSRQLTINGVMHDLSSNASWSMSIPDAYTKTESDARYLQSFTESDPTVPSYAKTLTGFSVIKPSTDALYYPLSSNPSGYLTSEVDGNSSNEIQTLSLNSGSLQLSLGGGTVTLPTITASTGISVTNGSVITNTLPDQVVSLTGANGMTVTGTYPNFTVTRKRQLPYSVVTAGSGVATGTFSAFSSAPNIQANIVNGSANHFITMSVTTTGFTVNAYVRNTVNLLGAEVLLGATSALNGASIDILITEK